MRFLSLLIIATLLVGLSGCRTPRRTCKRPVVETLLSPVKRIKHAVFGNKQAARAQLQQPNVLQSNQPHFAYDNVLPEFQVADDCGCAPSKVIEYSDPMVESGQPVYPIQSDGDRIVEPQAPVQLELPADQDNQLDVNKIPGINGNLTPGGGFGLEIPDQTSRVYRDEPAIEVGSKLEPIKPDVDEPVKEKVKAIPASSSKVLVEPANESWPRPFSEMSEEEAKEHSSSQLPASIEPDSANGEPIVLHAVPSRWMLERDRMAALIETPEPSNVRNPYRSNGGQFPDYTPVARQFEVPVDNKIHFTELPPISDQASPELSFPTENQDLPSPRRTQDPVLHDKTTQYYRNEPFRSASNSGATSDDSKRNFVVESTAIYQPMPAKPEVEYSDKVLRLSAVTGSGVRVVDQRGSVASFRMVTPKVVRGGYYEKDTRTDRENVSNVVNPSSKTTLRILER